MIIKLIESILKRIRPSIGATAACALVLGLFPLQEASGLTVSIEVEQGTYVAGDPVPMTVTVGNFSPGDCTGGQPITVQVHLTPDANFGSGEDGEFQNNDHRLTTLTGPGLAEGQSYTWTWVQRMPGQFDGTFFVHAQASGNGCSGTVTPAGLQDAKVTLVGQNHPETSLVSISEAGDLGNDISETPSISQDGRWVAFASVSDHMLGGVMQGEGDDAVFVTPINNNVADIFIRDQWTGEVERVTWPVSGGGPDGASLLPRLSADPDARWVAFHSEASNLIAEQVNNDVSDVYLHDRQTGDHVLVSRGIDEEPGNGVSRAASVSADGRWVAFESEANNLVAGDSNNVFDIFVADMENGEIRRVNVTNQGVQATGGPSRNARVSADGRHVVFESQATNLHSGGAPGLWEVYVHDRDANDTGILDEPGGIATRRLSVDYDLSGNSIYSDGNSFEANLSPDGRFVTFVSGATTLFSEPATGTIILDGKATEASVLFEENDPGAGTIGFQPDVPATGTIEFTANPSGGQSVEISDGVTSETFEFAEAGWEVSPGNVRVTLGASANATRNTMIEVINRTFVIEDEDFDEQTMHAEAQEINGNPGLLITNRTQGVAGNNQPIGDGNAPDLNVTGMDGAVVNQPGPGDTLEIDNNRTSPVTVRFYEEGDSDPTDLDARVLGVEIGRTAKETSLNLLSTFVGLGYAPYDLPEIPAHMLSPLIENPRDGDWFLFRHGEEEENGNEEDEVLVEAAFTFVDSGPQFDPANPTRILIGETPEETRGNLMRAIGYLFEFEPLPAIVEDTGAPFILGESLVDLPAEGRVELVSLPEDGHTVTIGDGALTMTFRFQDERDQTDEEEELDIPVPAFEPVGLDLMAVYLIDGDDVTPAQMEGRLTQAIEASDLEVFAAQTDDGIEIVHYQVGEIGNVEITKAPVRDEEEIDDGEAPWVVVEGMAGGSSGEAIADGGRMIFYPENLVHPRVIFEFREDLEDLNPNAHFGVQIGETGGETEGNFLAAIYQSGLPRVIAVEEDEDLPNVVLRSQIGAAGGVVVYDFSPSDSSQFAVLSSDGGEVRSPSHGGTIIVDDATNAPVTFEFTSDGTVRSGNIPVAISQVVGANRDNLIRAVNEAENLDVKAIDATIGGETRVRLVKTVPGPPRSGDGDFVVGEDLGNSVSIVDRIDGQLNPEAGESFTIRDGVNDEVTFEFADPADPNDPSQIQIGYDANGLEDSHRTRDNLIQALKDTGIQIDGVAFTSNARPGVRLTHFSTGSVGNFPIRVLTENASFSATGMAGGGSLTSGVEQVYLVDRDANDNGIFDQHGQITLDLISKTPLGTAGNHISREPTVSADGRFVAFRSQANDLLPLTVTRSDGEVFTNIVDPQILFSATIEDGDIVMRAVGEDLSSEISRFTDFDDFPDIYLFDREEGTHRRVDVNRFGESMLASSLTQVTVNGPTASRKPAISADGRFIVFESDFSNLWHGATNLQPLDLNSTRDVYVHDQRFPSSGVIFDGTVVLEEPMEPISVGTSVPLRATVSDLEAGRTVQSVEFFANGVSIGTAEAPIVPNGLVSGSDRFFDFSVNWTPGQAQNYNLSAEATDSRGRTLPLSNVVQRTVVAPTGNPPGLAIVSPQSFVVDDDQNGDDENGENGVPTITVNNQTTFPFMAQVTPGNVGVNRVVFFLRGEYIGDAIRAGDFWRLDFDLSQDFLGDDLPMAPGVYEVTAIAFDENGNTVSDTATSLNVVNPSEEPSLAPRLTISSPVIGRGQSVMLMVHPEDGGSGLVSVNFYANGQLIGVSGAGDDDDDENGGIFRTAWTPNTTGIKQIYATAIDVNGHTVVSELVELDVRPVDGVSPSVSIISPDEDVSVTNLSEWRLSAVASGSSGKSIDQVEFFLSGESIGTASRVQNTNLADDANIPESLHWLLTHGFDDAELGVHDLVAVARDSSGNVTASAPVEVTVTGATSAPPEDFSLSVSGGFTVDGERGFTRNQSIQINAVVDDADGRIESVAFFRNGILWEEGEENGNPVEEEPFTYRGPVSVSGVYEVFAVATDDTGNTRVSNIETITSLPPEQFSVEVVTPTAGERFTVAQAVGEEEEEGLTGASPVQIRVEYNLPSGVAVSDVTILIDGEELGENQLRRQMTQRFTRTDWLSNVIGEVSISAVVTPDKGPPFVSDAVTVTIVPLGIVVGNPADPGNNTDFVTQSVLDLLRRAPDRGELLFFTNQLADEELTRGEVIERIMINSDFNPARWVIATYITVLGEYPTTEQFKDGIDLLEFGEDDGDSGVGEGSLAAGVPLNLPVLIDDILSSSAFTIRHQAQGNTMRRDRLLDLVWEDNLGRKWRTYSQRQRHLEYIDPEFPGGLGRVAYLFELIAGSPFETVEATVAEEGIIDSRANEIERAAMILLLLDRDIQPGEVQALSRNAAVAGDALVTSEPYARRFGGSDHHFFGISASTILPTKNSDLFGTFDDRHFNYVKREGWIDHQEHGWLFVSGAGYPGGMWMWDDIQQDWLWTRLDEDRYPFLFSDSRGWIFYRVGGQPGGREFYFYDVSQWETIKR